jgi:hypothetical protein
MNLPASIKLRRTTVATFGDDEQQLAHARQRVKELERDAATVEREINERYLLALGEERTLAERKLQHALDLGPGGKHRVKIEINSNTYLTEQTGAQLQREAEQQIQAIDAELQRVSRTRTGAPA